jgi:hypothetical protein
MPISGTEDPFEGIRTEEEGAWVRWKEALREVDPDDRTASSEEISIQASYWRRGSSHPFSAAAGEYP